MGRALVARDPWLTFHFSPVLEIRHSRRWIKQVVGKFCNQRISVDHTGVLHFRRICWRASLDSGNLCPLGRSLYASSYSGGGPILGSAQGLLLYGCRFRAPLGLVYNARGSDIVGRWALCSHLIVD